MANDTEFYKNLRADLKLNEGNISHMYLDTRGYVTVGVGSMIPNVEEAQRYNFRYRESGAKASANDIAKDFESVKQQPKGKVASSYKSATKLDLPDGEIDEILDRHIEEFQSSLMNIFPAYPSYPDPAKQGLLDMAFNLGIAGLTRKFPTFVAHAKDQNWRGCAEECQRRGISDARNAATKSLFLAAGN